MSLGVQARENLTVSDYYVHHLDPRWESRVHGDDSAAALLRAFSRGKAFSAGPMSSPSLPSSVGGESRKGVGYDGANRGRV